MLKGLLKFSRIARRKNSPPIPTGIGIGGEKTHYDKDS
jgi:hypothetical protein